MNKLVTHYRNSTQLKKEDLTQAEKEEIISTLNLVKKCESLGPEAREDEFMTMCFNFGLDDDQTRAAKEIFLGIEPSEIWEKNILALERGEWVDSMETKCFKRWNKQRPSLVTTLEYIFQCKIAEPTTNAGEGRLKDSMGDNTIGTISEGEVVQFARWFNDDMDEAEAERRIQEITYNSKRERAVSTPTLLTRNSPPPLPRLPSPAQDNDNEENTKKGKPETRNRFNPLTSSTSPISPRKSQEGETEKKAEIKRKKSKKHTGDLSKSAEEKKQNEGKDKRKASWVRKLSADRDLGKKKDSEENWRRRGSVDSLTEGTISVVFREEMERERKEKKEKEKDREEGRKGDKKDKKDKKAAPLLCWMGSSENLRTIDENSEFSRVMMTRSRDSPTQEKRREIESFAKVKSSQTKEMENLAKAKTIEVYQSFKM